MITLNILLVRKRGQIYVKNAFVNAPLSEEISIAQPQGFEKKDLQNKLYKLYMAFYGLEEASREGNVYLHKFLMPMSCEKK